MQRRMRAAVGAFAVVALGASASAASPAIADWRNPACEIDGGERAATAACTPPAHAASERLGPNSCAGAVACEVDYQELRAAGLGGASEASIEDARATAGIERRMTPRRSGRIRYGGWLSLYNYKGRRCRGTVRDSGHCAWLYHKYRVFEGGDPLGGIHVTAYPARSGDDDPSHSWIRNLGPIPERFRASAGGRIRDDYRWGHMNGRFTGYESDGRDSFYPGLWRLDPWVVHKPSRPRRERSSFEIHGGRNSDGSSRLWTTRTNGCVRLSIAGIRGLKGKWDRRTDNRRTARVYIVHNP
jgi:hypothetical protein